MGVEVGEAEADAEGVLLAVELGDGCGAAYVSGVTLARIATLPAATPASSGAPWR